MCRLFTFISASILFRTLLGVFSWTQQGNIFYASRKQQKSVLDTGCIFCFSWLSEIPNTFSDGLWSGLSIVMRTATSLSNKHIIISAVCLGLLSCWRVHFFQRVLHDVPKCVCSYQCSWCVQSNKSPTPHTVTACANPPMPNWWLYTWFTKSFIVHRRLISPKTHHFMSLMSSFNILAQNGLFFLFFSHKPLEKKVLNCPSGLSQLKYTLSAQMCTLKEI